MSTTTSTASASAIVNEKQTPNGSTFWVYPHHHEQLASRGISEETARREGIRSASNVVELTTILGRKWDRKQMSAIVIPYFGDLGEVILHRVRPDKPPVRNGKLAKYLSPMGSLIRVYIPKSVRESGALDDTSKPMFVTEGEFKTLKANQEGFLCVGLMGVDCWHTKKSTQLHPDLARIAWKGRLVYIAFDSDAIENENVATNESLLAAALTNHGATVKVVRIPAGPVGQDGKPTKVGLDDFLTTHGADELHKLLNAAEPPESPTPEDVKVNAKELDPAFAAESFLAKCEVDGVSKIRFWRGGFHLWTRGAYQEISPSEVRVRIVQHLNKNCTGVTGRVVADVLEQLRAQSYLAFTVNPPTWVDEHPAGWHATEMLATRNRIVHLPSFVDGTTSSSISPTPRLFTTVATDYDFSPTAPPVTAWMEFLDQAWPSDPESISLLQEWMGYTLTPDTRQQKILLIVGPKRSGKGTIGRIARAMIGAGNVAGPTLASLGERFGIGCLLGKSLAIISDARLSGRSDQAVITERLLSISGEDAQTIDRKYQEPVTCKLPTRFVILTNELPRLTDASGALASRMMVLQMTESFYGREDHGLTERLLSELPGILLWAIEGWKRLRERGRFIEPESSREMAEALDDLASPVKAFVRERCVIDPNCEISRSLLFSEYLKWCALHGRTRPDDEAGFGRNLRAVVPTLRDIQHREMGRPARYYGGIDVN